MSASSYLPQFVAAKTKNDLIKALADVQLKYMGKVSIVTIYYDSGTREHVCWYFPLRNLGGMS
jgi:hypothetical protein